MLAACQGGGSRPDAGHVMVALLALLSQSSGPPKLDGARRTRARKSNLYAPREGLITPDRLVECSRLIEYGNGRIAS